MTKRYLDEFDERMARRMKSPKMSSPSMLTPSKAKRIIPMRFTPRTPMRKGTPKLRRMTRVTSPNFKTRPPMRPGTPHPRASFGRMFGKKQTFIIVGKRLKQL